MSERESRPGESGSFVSLDAVPVTGGMSGGMGGALLSGDIIPTGGGPRVDKIHGVLTDDPQLLSAVVKAIDGDTGAAVLIIAEKFRMFAWEASEVLAAVLGEGERPAGCFLDVSGRLRLMSPASEILDEIREVRKVAPSLLGATLTMPSPTRPSGVRSLDLEEIDAVFNLLDQERRQTGEDLEAPSETLAWMRLELARLDVFESAFLVVNELCPPSDWLRDLKAASHDPDALVELVQRATAARVQKDVARVEVGDRHNCHTCAHGGQFACNLLGAMRSEALTWRASNSTGDGCPGWEGKAMGEGFQAPSAPAQPSIALFCADGTSLDLDAPYNTCPACGAPAKIVTYPADDDGPALWSLICSASAVCGWELLESEQPLTLRSLISLQLSNAPLLQGVVMSALSRGSQTSLTPAQSTALEAMRTRAQSFILADTCMDATPYEKGAHDAATSILRGDLSKGDPRVTLRGQVEEARQHAHALETMLAQVTAQRDRLTAVLSAETGQRGLPGWTWDAREQEWSITIPQRASATAWGAGRWGAAGFHVRGGSFMAIPSVSVPVPVSDMLHGMELAEVELRKRESAGVVVPVEPDGDDSIPV